MTAPADHSLQKEPELLRRRLRRQLLRDLLHGVPLAGATLEAVNDYYCLDLQPGFYNVLMIRLRPRQPQPPTDLSAALDYVAADARMFLTGRIFLEVETLQENDTLYCLLNFDAQFGTPESEEVRGAVDRLYRHMDISRRYRPFYFTMGDGLPVQRIWDAGSSFLSARSAVEEYDTDLHVNRRHDSAQQMYAMAQIMNILTPARRSSFSHYLETLQREPLFQWVDDAFRDCQPYLGQLPTILYQLPYKILDLCLDALGNTVAADPQLQQLLLDCRSAIDGQPNYSLLSRVVQEGLGRFCDQYAQILARENNSAVLAAKSFMRAQYARHLTLNEIAGQVHLNPQYFSVLFKRETGESVVGYLTNLRVEHAKSLLKDTALPIHEVALQSGYDDPDYFSRLFRKANGMTPRQYRTIVGKE